MLPKLEADDMIEFEQIVAASEMDDGPHRVKQYVKYFKTHFWSTKTSDIISLSG